jgi:membrane protein DedA with SNARE-associated domain
LASAYDYSLADDNAPTDNALPYLEASLFNDSANGPAQKADPMIDIAEWAGDLVDAMTDLSGGTAYAAIVGILTVCGLGIPIPEDITLLAAGLLASTGKISFSGALVAGFLGVIFGDAVLFFLGRKYGKRIFLLPGFRRIFTPERVRLAEAKVKGNGPFICFVARFLPGIRSPTFAMAGAMGVRPIVFFSLDGFAALISVPVWVSLGFWFGENWDEAIDRARRAEGFILTAIGSLVLGYVIYRLWRKRKRGR